MEDNEKKRHFKNAMNNYLGVMRVMDRYHEEIVHDHDAPVPENWADDPLLLLGEYLDALVIPEEMKVGFRRSTLELVERNGVEAYWKARRRYAAEIEFIIDF